MSSFALTLLNVFWISTMNWNEKDCIDNMAVDKISMLKKRIEILKHKIITAKALFLEEDLNARVMKTYKHYEINKNSMYFHD